MDVKTTAAKNNLYKDDLVLSDQATARNTVAADGSAVLGDKATAAVTDASKTSSNNSSQGSSPLEDLFNKYKNANNPAPASTPVSDQNQYYGINGNRQAYSPNSDNLSNTGSGATAAEGTQYSWNQKGNEKAKTSYSAEVLEAKQNLLTNRQTIENNAVNYQAQSDMMKYQNNQNAEKVGWTGGYVLDQNRQMEYLKASIQAQMYGAMELQKYGHDSALAAARLSYDLNQQEYARQYYEQAVSQALSEAQTTGVYFSAEVKDMMSQRAVAEQKLRENPDDEQAKKLIDQIDNWFSSNKISKEGVKTLEAWNADQNNELQWSSELWNRYNAAIKAANTNLSEDNRLFIKLDENGNEVFDGTNVQTGNWETMTGKDIIDYISNNSAAANQYYSYLDSTITGQVESGFKDWCKANGFITTDKDGNEAVKPGENYQEMLMKYINTSGVLDKFESTFKDVSESIVRDIMENWDFTISLPDGTNINTTYRDLLKQSEGEPGNNSGSGKDGNKIGQVTKVTNGNYSWSVTPYYNGNGSFFKTTLSDGKSVCVTNSYTTRTNSSNTITIADKKYDVDISGSSGINVNSTTDKELTALVKSLTNSQIIRDGTTIIYNNKIYTYYNDAATETKWLGVSATCGGSSKGYTEALRNAGQWAY